MTKKIFTRGVKKESIHRRYLSINIVSNKLSLSMLFIAFALFATLVSPAFVKPAAAAPEWPGNNYIADEVYKNTSTNQHYFWLYACFRNTDINKVSPGEMDSWDFFEGITSAQALGAMYPGETSSGNIQGTRNCETESIVKTAFGYLGFDNPREVFCSLDGAQYRDDNKGGYEDCVAGVGDHDWDNTQEDNGKLAAAFEKLASSKRPAFGGAEEYIRAYATLVSARGCKMTFTNTKLYESAGDVPKAGSSSSQYAVPVFVPDDDGSLVARFIQGVGVPNGDSDNLAYVATREDNAQAYQKKDCNEIVNIARSNAGAYKTWIAAHPEAPESNELAEETGSAEEDTTTCAIDNVGWIICPAMSFMAGIIDAAYNQIAAWLVVTPISTDTTGGSGTGTMYSAWSTMRNLANIAFVIAFMVIIYSQLTGVGLSNYGIKKMLPKIMMAAILVNVSFWVCAVAVDISNIAGKSLYSLFDTEVYSQGIKTEEFGNDISSTGNGWTGIVTGILATAGLYLALPALIVALPAALLAIVTVFLVLALRQVLIILLIVISPLAFVALLLPNTEDLFKKWKGLFQTLLLLYPIIAVIFGASAMASTIVMNSAKDIEGDGKLPIQIMGALITILPLAITPIVMKFGGGVLGRFGGMVNNPNKGPFDAMRKRTDALGGRIRNRRTASGIERGQKIGSKVRDSQIGRRGAASSAYLQDRIKGSGNSKIRSALADRYGRTASRASNAIELGASMGATGKVDAAERDKYAKIGADGAARNYVADRASGDQAYARSLAGGSEKMGQSVQDYAVQAKANERVNDIKAASARIADLSNDAVAKIAASGIHNGEKASADVFAAATHRIQESGSFDERQDSLAFLASLKSLPKDAAELGANATLRGEAAQRAIGRGDSEVYGPGFANNLIKEGASTINDKSGLINATVQNASDGSLSAEHLVKNNKATKFIVEKIMASGDAYAINNLKTAAKAARVQASTAGKVTDQMDAAFKQAGV